MNKLVIPEGYEVRAELVRVYPEETDHYRLALIQDEVRHVWNECVREREDVKRARAAVALKQGLVGPAPTLPPRPDLPKPSTAEEKAAVREAWKEYKRELKANLPKWAEWYAGINAAVKDRPELAWRNTPYHYFRAKTSVANSVVIRDTVKRLRKTKGAQYKSKRDPVPLVWGNSPTIKTGGFYGMRRNIPWYNALIQVNGMAIKGRLRRPLPGKPVQGVTLNLRADGWYAAVKCIVPKRALPAPVLPPVGVDVGQTKLVALSDGYTERNERDAKYRLLKAEIQRKADTSNDPELVQQSRRRIARLDQASKRRIQHWLNAQLLPRLETREYVFVENLAKNFKSNTGPTSVMHETLNAIKLRLGDRVREVDCAYTSQTCSQCGIVNKNARHGEHFTCLEDSCLAIMDADINAARNILARGLKLLGLPET